MMRNQPLPKLSVTDTFYSRQAWVYNLTFVIMSENDQSKDNCYLYTWHEGESGRGPNEIGSALIILEILEERYKTVRSQDHLQYSTFILTHALNKIKINL